MFPEAVQAELDEALESGRYESDRPPRVLETIDIEELHARIDGTVYTPAVDGTGDGADVLSLEEETNPTLSEPRTLDTRKRSAESRTLTVRVEAPDGNEAEGGDGELEVEVEVELSTIGCETVEPALIACDGTRAARGRGDGYATRGRYRTHDLHRFTPERPYSSYT